jgi:tetratricopeptide (TPR) repeat protein
MEFTSIHISRAEVLLEQNRIQNAISELKQALQSDPDNDYAYALFARCHYRLEQHKEGLEKIQKAIALKPDESYYFYLRGFAHYHLNNSTVALTDLNHAISLFPYNAEYFGLYAFILIDERSYELALNKANEGLELDPENLTCLNARARALNKLKRNDEAIDTMQDALSSAPESDFTHVTIGFNHLERGKHKDAQQHFREALRLSPTLSSAKEGLKESLKSNFPPYRVILQLSYWLGEKGKNFRIAFTIGLYILFRILTGVAKTYPAARLFIVPFIVLYFVYFIFSWIGSSLANFMLLFHKDGKYIVDNWERYTAITIVVCLLTGITIGVTAYVGVAPDSLILAGVALASMCIPISRFEDGAVMKPGSVKFIYSSILIVLGFTAALSIMLFPLASFGSILFGIYFVGLIIYMWTAGGWN